MAQGSGVVLETIAHALSQIQGVMQSMRSKMERTDLAVKGVADVLTTQGNIIQKIDQRMQRFEGKAGAPLALPVLAGRTSSSPSRSAASAPRSRTPPTFCVYPASVSVGAGAGTGSGAERCGAAIGRRLLRAVASRKKRRARRLLDAGADPNFAAEGQWAPLHKAAAEAHVGLVCLLVQRGADVNARSRPLRLVRTHEGWPGDSIELPRVDSSAHRRLPRPQRQMRAAPAAVRGRGRLQEPARAHAAALRVGERQRGGGARAAAGRGVAPRAGRGAADAARPRRLRLRAPPAALRRPPRPLRLTTLHSVRPIRVIRKSDEKSLHVPVSEPIAASWASSDAAPRIHTNAAIAMYVFEPFD